MQRKNLITYRELSKLFLKFLKENNALEKYKRKLMLNIMLKPNMENVMFYINPMLIVLKEPIKRYDISDLISCAFIWKQTNEGEDFWASLDFEWNRMICEANFEIISEKLHK